MPIVIGELAIALMPMLAALVLLGLSQTHSVQYGTEQSQGFWAGFWNFLGHGGAVTALWNVTNQAVRWVVSKFAAAQLKAVSRWFLGMGTLALGYFIALPAFAEAVALAIERLDGRGDPTARKHAQTARSHADHAQRTANNAQAGASAANARAGNVSTSLARYKATTNAKIHHLSHAVDVTLPHSIGQVRTREKTLTKDVAKLRERTTALEDGAIKTWDWIRAHPVSVATGAFAAAVSVALDRLGFGGIKCPSFGNLFNKRGCGLWGILDDILGLLADVVAITAICDVLPWLEAGVSDIAVPVVEGLTAAGAGLCKGSIGPAPALAVPALYLPSSSGLTLNLP